MSQPASGSLIKIAPIVFSLFLGGVGGYFFHSSVGASQSSSATSPGGMPGGGMGGGQQSSGASLSRTVRGLAMLEKAQNKGLTAEQTQRLLPIAQDIQAADKLPEAEAAAKLAAVEAVLTEDQKQALQTLQPARGGGGRPAGGGMAGGGMAGGGMAGGGMAGGGTAGGGMAGGGMAGGGMAGGGTAGGGMAGGGMAAGRGAPPAPDKPFASDRNKTALEDLIASLKPTQ